MKANQRYIELCNALEDTINSMSVPEPKLKPKPGKRGLCECIRKTINNLFY
jgi:hypothetical protein